MKKRGQVSVFMILGLLILLGVGIGIYFRQASIEEREFVRPELVPVKDFVESYVYMLGEEGIRRIGSTGGFIEIPAEIDRNPFSHLAIIPGGGLKLPYWYYQGRNTAPPLYAKDGIGSVQEQLSSYIKNNLKAYLAGFKAFEKEFLIKELKDITVDVVIGEKDVRINIFYPLEITDKAKNEVSLVSRFNVNLPVRLKEVYELASRIMETENREAFLENITINLMSMNPDIPFTGLRFSCPQLRWYLADIKTELQDTLYYQIPRIRIKNTDYFPFLADESVYEELGGYSVEDIYNDNLPEIEPPEDAYEYFHYFKDVKSPENDFRVGFLYLQDWGMELRANPSSNGVLKSNTGKGALDYLSFLCLNIYHFTYDVEYPVEVLIRDNKAFNNEGYVFRFAFPVVIDHNRGSREYTGITLPEFPETLVGDCEDFGEDVYDIRVTGINEYGEPAELSGVNISYNCYRFICSLGKTGPDVNVNRLRTGLPKSCGHGILIAEKNGYLKSEQQVLDDTNINIEITKLEKFNFSVLMHEYYANIDSFGEAKELEDYHIALISLQSHDRDELLQYKRYPFEPDSTKQSKTVELIDTSAKYRLDIILADERDNSFIGGYRGNWSYSYKDLVDKKRVVFHVLEYLPTPVGQEAQFEMMKFLEDDENYKERFKPKLR
ncbi:hypothetical protein CMO89_03740 [Candidatus Woesearchaeota archaeon]|nr:hypothetical protein [Candidatus Woesearchaeota archaeon]